MSISSLVEMDWLLASMSAQAIKRAATSISGWQKAMETSVPRVNELLNEEKYALLDVDVSVIREPLNFTATDSSPIYPDSAAAGIRPQALDGPVLSPAGRIARVKACSSLPETWRSDYAMDQPEVHARPASGVSSVSGPDRQDRDASLSKGETILNNSVQLLVVLQRYAERLKQPPLTRTTRSSADRRISLNVTMNVENVTASLPQRRNVRPLLAKKGKIGRQGTIGSSGNTAGSLTSAEPTTLDRFGHRAMRKLESWLDDIKTSDAPKRKIESTRSRISNSVVGRAETRKGIESSQKKLNDEGTADEGETVSPSRFASPPKTKNSRTRPLHDLSRSHLSSDVGDESLLTAGLIREMVDKSVVAGKEVKARPVQNGMARMLQTAGSTSTAKLEKGKLSEQPMLMEMLERIVGKLVNIETKYVEIAAQAREDADAESKEASVEWLNDDDLTMRLQRILKRQARRRGIDLS
jgi:hypothetical protein